ncbi:hypothetical protein SAMN05421678_112126 [Actinopolymorpha cephalotaxi]|uniref:Type VI protein secretion system component VasK n=1 Tax=Actinopolymorpha cephalotaxi TaxID=504797 RepID=A0A1I2XD25_9ACTN|nr:hypothetical protein [Actinopolymorpha cephalotaxi]NYH86191.1 type VI protein secretion system component VasK [Actinopolymorpha cephalotaxi]SFH11365.1 hypothetical protein SAMN05421678_112126 [Actinopolymorpha cephalotaxi]
MNVRRIARMLVGAVLVALGALWVLQGADLVRIKPVLCVADCQPLVGGSPVWLAVGVVAFLAGLALLTVRRGKARPRQGQERQESREYQE